MIRFLRSVPRLDENCSYGFPPVEGASPEGIVCVGGNLSPGILLSAYRQGIFPWYGENEPLLWWSPDPRFAVFPETFHVSATSRKLLRRGKRKITLDLAFDRVIESCARVKRPGQDGTWIVNDMIDAYKELHRLGYAHSAEAWIGDELAGGLYGVSLGDAFFGESMFSAVSGASRAAFLCLAMTLFESGFTMIDSQVYTGYVASMGGVDVPRKAYLDKLAIAVSGADRRGPWHDRFKDFPASAGLADILGADGMD